MTRTEQGKNIKRPGWLSDEVWPFRLRTADLGNSTVAYTDEGDGPAILFVHDGMCSFVWGQTMERLREGYRVVTLDFPGSGLSPSSGEVMTLRDDSHTLERFVDHLGLESFILVVHDLGGGVGLAMATRRPNLITGLVLVNTFAWPPSSLGLRAMLRLMGSRPITALSRWTNVVARASSTRFGVGRHLDEAARFAFLRMFERKESRARFHALMRSAAGELGFFREIESDLDTLGDRPVMTVFGERNDPFGFQDLWSEHFPHAEHMVITGGYHFPMCDDPEGVANQIDGWVRRKVLDSA